MSLARQHLWVGPEATSFEVTVARPNVPSFSGA